jgi:hypothetical protein
VVCPLCGGKFNVDVIELHAASCGNYPGDFSNHYSSPEIEKESEEVFVAESYEIDKGNDSSEIENDAGVDVVEVINSYNDDDDTEDDDVEVVLLPPKVLQAQMMPALPHASIFEDCYAQLGPSHYVLPSGTIQVEKDPSASLVIPSSSTMQVEKDPSASLVIPSSSTIQVERDPSAPLAIIAEPSQLHLGLSMVLNHTLELKSSSPLPPVCADISPQFLQSASASIASECTESTPVTSDTANSTSNFVSVSPSDPFKLIPSASNLPNPVTLMQTPSATARSLLPKSSPTSYLERLVAERKQQRRIDSFIKINRDNLS